MKVTLTEIAFEAGVSITTVDRVLNEREGVRQRTRDMVLDIARRRGWFGPAGHQEPLIRMDIVLPAGSNTFLALLRRYLIEEAQNIGGIRLMVHISDGLNPELMASRLASLVGKTDAVGVVALDHPLVRAAIESLSAIYDAIGVRMKSLPATPEKILQALKDKVPGREQYVQEARVQRAQTHRL